MKKERFVKAKPKLYDTDILMKNLFYSLTRDFRSLLGPNYAQGARDAFKQGVSAYRKYKFPSRMEVAPYIFKREYQLENLFKRYRFADDVYTDDELEDNTYQKFFDHQIMLGETTGKQYRASTLCVLQKARRIISKILGDYDEEELLGLCRFGKRACKGTPGRNSYLDCKLENLTGSSEHLDWFVKTYLPSDNILSGILGSAQTSATYTVCDSLDSTNVDKSWKIKRGIVPNTAVGSFHSYGLGMIFALRLRKIGLNISTLQQKHRRLAKKFSKSRKYVTADMSNASNSFTYPILARLLPRRWLNAIKFGRIPRISIDKGPYKGTHLIQSYMLMGIGYTFSLQTLLFYAVITAVKELLGIEGFVSVYGDDLIYPRELHTYVTSVFEDLNFSLNQDKTYEKEFFRESCGGDYYRGVDVRPYSFQGSTSVLGKLPYVSMLYKIANGLLKRWEPSEISQTLHFLISQISAIDGIVCRVPTSFPDYSGLCVDKIVDQPWYIPWATVHHYNSQMYSTAYYAQFRARTVMSEAVYYWDKMRASSVRDLMLPVYVDEPGQEVSVTRKFLDQLVTRADTDAYKHASSRSMFNLRAYKPIKFYRSKLTGRRVKRKYATVAEKGGQPFNVRQYKPLVF